MNSDRTYLSARDHLKRASATLQGTGRDDLCAIIDEMAMLVERLRQQGANASNVVSLERFRRDKEASH